MPRQGIRARLRNRLTDRRTNRVLARHAIEREFGDNPGPWTTPRSWAMISQLLDRKTVAGTLTEDECMVEGTVLHKRLFAEALLRGDVHFKEGE